MLRENENWLRYRVDKTIARKHSSLLNAIKKRNTRNFFTEWISTEHWYVTVLLTLLVFLAGTLVFHVFDLPKDHPKNDFATAIKDIGGLIESRTSNLSTIAGLSLAVIAFLMGNIAIKENYAFQIVLEKTKFSTVVIAVLTALIFFVLIGTFRSIYKPDEWYLDLMLSAMFVFIGILILIGYIFRSAIRYTNPNAIDELVNETMILNASCIIYDGLVPTYSLAEYQQLMAQRGCTKYDVGAHFDKDWFNFSMTKLTPEQIRAREARQVYITDVNMIGLSAYLHSKKDEKLYYHDTFIGLRTDNLENYAFQLNVENDRGTKTALRNFIRSSRSKKDTLALTELRKHYDTRLIDYAEAGKDKELHRLLNGLSQLYELQMTFQHSGEFELTGGLQSVLAEALRTSIRKKHLGCFRQLLTFCSANCFKAIELLDLQIFTLMLSFYPDIFSIVKLKASDGAYQDFLPLALDPAGFYELFLYKISEQKKERPDKIKIINDFGRQAYRAYNLLLYYMLSLKDYKGLLKAIKLLDKPLGDEPDYKARAAYLKALRKTGDDRDAKEVKTTRQQFAEAKVLQVHKQRTISSIRGWIFHLRRWNKLTIEETIQLTTAIKVAYNETEDVLDDILYYRQGLTFYFTWQSWVFPDYFDSEETGIGDPTEWLTFGFMADQIIRFQLPVFDIGLQLEKVQHLDFLISQLKQNKQYFVTNFTDWKDILKVVDLTELERKADAVISYFERLESTRVQTGFKLIADAKIKSDALIEFKKLTAERWQNESGVYQFFKEMNTTGTPAPDLFIGLNEFIPDLKQFFVNYKEPADIRILADLGAQAGRLVDEEFFFTIINKQPSGKSGSLLEIVSAAIEELKSMDIKPDCIFVSATRLYLEQEFLDDDRYVEKEYNEEKPQPKSLKGWFNDVPVYSSYANSLEGFAVIASFEEAFKADFGQIGNTETPTTIVDTFDRAEAETLAAARSHPETPTEKAILRLQNGIQLQLGITGSFDIANEQAIITGKLT